MINELMNATVTTIDDEPVTLSYLEEGGPGEETRTMRKPLRQWLTEYMKIAMTQMIQWQTSKEIDETGGDLVRIWTEDLVGTPLEDDCDRVVWQTPDDTVGEDFVKFLSRN